MSFPYKKGKQPSSTNDYQQKNFSSINNNYFNKENISSSGYSANQGTSSILTQQYLSQKVNSQPVPLLNNFTSLPSQNISQQQNSKQQQNSRYFGRDLSNYYQSTSNFVYGKTSANGSLSNSRCASRDYSSNNRKPTSVIQMSNNNNIKANGSANVIAEKSSESNNVKKLSHRIPNFQEVQCSAFSMELESNPQHYSSLNQVSEINQSIQQQSVSLSTQCTSFNSRIHSSILYYNPQLHSQNTTGSEPIEPCFMQPESSFLSQKNCQQFSPLNNRQQNISRNCSIKVKEENSLTESVDIKNMKRPEYVPQYAKEIFDYLRANEEKYICKTPYFELEKQPDLNSRMRTILIDWLVDIHLKFDLLPETLFLTVNLIDRFLEKGPKVEKSNFQLVGIASLFIAAKYEEIYPPEVKEFTYICYNAYTKQQLFEYEGYILQTLNFNITTPSSFRFLERYARISQFDQKQFLIALYFLEMSLVDYSGIKFTPSLLACGSILISSIITNKQEIWCEALVRNTKYDQSQLVPVVNQLYEIHKKSDLREKQTQDKEKLLNAVKRKYSQVLFESVYTQISAFFSFSTSTNKSVQIQQAIN